MKFPLQKHSNIMTLSCLAVVGSMTVTPASAQTAAPAATAPAPAPAPSPDFTIRQRGRLHVDIGSVSGPAGLDTSVASRGVEVRRLRFGVEGDLPGAFDYRVDADFSGDTVEFVDAWVRYRAGPVSVTVGQHNGFQSLEELTSSNDASFVERAAFTDAFGFERRLGIGVEYAKDGLVAQAGVYGDTLLDISDGEDTAYSVSGRLAYGPRFGTTQLHFGVHGSYRDLGEAGRNVRYRQRPFTHVIDRRYVATPNLLSSEETQYGAEIALLRGRFHAQGEVHWASLDRLTVGAADPTFFGGAAEAGVFLTNDGRRYRNGIFRGVDVRRPVTEGGLGAVQIVARYDWLDLTDAGVAGGRQAGYMAGITWWPVSEVRFMLNYARLDYRGAAVAAAGNRDYSVDAVSGRFQVVF